MRLIQLRRCSLLTLYVGLACVITTMSGCGGPAPSAGADAEAKSQQPAVTKTAAVKAKSKLKNVDPLGSLGVRELRALKKAQQTQ